MFTNNNLSDYEDTLPRNAPNPSATFPEQCTKPSPTVPEISLMFDGAQKTNINSLNSCPKEFFARTMKPVNPTPPKTSVPELSLIFSTSSNSTEIGSPSFQYNSIQTTANKSNVFHSSKQNQSSLPIRSFSSFKKEYGDRISSTATRKKVAFEHSSFDEISKMQNDLPDDVEAILNINPAEIKNKVDKDTDNKIDTKVESDNKNIQEVANIDISSKLDNLTDVMQQLVREIQQLKFDFNSFKVEVKDALRDQNEQFKENLENIDRKDFFDFLNANRGKFSEEVEECECPQYVNGNEYDFKIANAEPIEEYNFAKSNQIFDRTQTGINEHHIDQINRKSPKSAVIKPKLVQRKVMQSNRKPILQSILDPLPENSALVITTERSLVMKKLAEKYLPERVYNAYITENENPSGKNRNTQFEKNLVEDNRHSNDLSIASYEYLQKYKLVPAEDGHLFGNNNVCKEKDNLLFFQDIKKGPKYM